MYYFHFHYTKDKRLHTIFFGNFKLTDNYERRRIIDVNIELTQVTLNSVIDNWNKIIRIILNHLKYNS